MNSLYFPTYVCLSVVTEFMLLMGAADTVLGGWREGQLSLQPLEGKLVLLIIVRWMLQEGTKYIEKGGRLTRPDRLLQSGNTEILYFIDWKLTGYAQLREFKVCL